MLQARQAFGVSNKQIPARDEMARQLGDELLLRGSIEVDHDVAAENHVKGC